MIKASERERERERERVCTLKRRSEVREREEVVEAPELGAGMADFFISVHGGVPRRVRRRSGWLSGGLRGLPRFLDALVRRVRTILPNLRLGRVLARRRRAKTRRAGDDVQEPPHVRHRALFIVALFDESERAWLKRRDVHGVFQSGPSNLRSPKSDRLASPKAEIP